MQRFRFEDNLQTLLIHWIHYCLHDVMIDVPTSII